MITKYVDNINIMCAMIELGLRYVKGQIKTTPEWLEEDTAQGRLREAVTMECIKAIADSRGGHYRKICRVTLYSKNKCIV